MVPLIFFEVALSITVRISVPLKWGTGNYFGLLIMGCINDMMNFIFSPIKLPPPRIRRVKSLTFRNVKRQLSGSVLCNWYRVISKQCLLHEAPFHTN